MTTTIAEERIAAQYNSEEGHGLCSRVAIVSASLLLLGLR